MSEGNRLERNGELIRKYFASHMDFSQESKVYEKLKGSGLCPEVTLQYDGFIEKKYVEGPSFAELYEEWKEDPARLAELFEDFCSWYKSFRDATNLLLGSMEPSKFIMTDHGFVYLDFEHCRPGFLETDLAQMIRWMCVVGGAVDAAGSAAARLFVCVCSSKLSLNPDRLERSLEKALAAYENQLGSLTCYMTASAVVVCRSVDSEELRLATAAFASAPERTLCVPAGASASCPGFHSCTGSEGSCLWALSRKTSQPWTMLLFTGPGCNPQEPFLIRTERLRELIPAPADVDVKALLEKEQQ